MDQIRVVYTLQEFPDPSIPSIFLAGPTPRKSYIKSWRPKALQIMRRYRPDVTVYYPEPVSVDKWSPDSDDHINWERAAMARSRVILFWVDRKLDSMPGFRTNTEWGYWTARDYDRLVLAYPPKAPGMRGMHNDALCYNIPYVHSLSAGIAVALEKALSTR
ncbi:nucleoside 2-deoxyribosyltransferase domain-containing protein [Candidatus Uhrbacteria bacterium]|nr:nucleoside 2-deoxyribosyltransferase domain-containing protein [Candidatus Uhrbacteria bacterium]